ncbi:MAG: hypothetical protein FIB03_02895 [Anaerolineae bacterium]|nr:hypothetical protein [Anaerolineae bacterium]
MRRFETPYVADWFAASLRWLMLVVFTLLLALRGQVGELFWVLVLMVGWNIIMSILAGLNMRLPYHRHIILGVDLILSALFYWVLGGAFAWVGLIPIATGAIYFEMWGAFITAILFVFWQVFVQRPSITVGYYFLPVRDILLTL